MDDPKEPLALVIDDQDDILQIVSLTLRYEGWRVVTAHNGREGLAAVRAETPALILADLMMPEMTGIEFCRRLLEEFGLNDVPVLMISGVNEKAKILNDFWEMPLRHHNFLHKPFSTDELLSAVQSILPRSLGKFPAQQVLATKPPPTPGPSSGVPQGSGLPPSGGIQASTPTPPKAATSKPLIAPFNPEAGRGFRILVVDDDPDIRMILKTTLTMFHVVEEASNGVEGLEMIDHFGPDIVLSDINMPQMDGMEMAAAIRRHPAYCAVPIFFLTGETDASLPRKAFDIGGNLYLRKPVDPIQLLKFIDHFLKEVGLQPGQLHAMARQGLGVPPSGGAQKSAAPALASVPPKGGTPKQEPPLAVRVLVVDFNFEHHRQLRELFEGPGGDALRVPGGPFEMFYAEELALAMGNLTRWEPDLVLYNPRTPGMPDGVAFGQSLRLRKLTQPPEVAFIGERFYDSEADYSRNNYKRGVIDLTRRGHSELVRMLGEAAAAARLKLKPKQYPTAQLRKEEMERQGKLQANSAREARQREIFRQKYAGLQEFIDHQL